MYLALAKDRSLTNSLCFEHYRTVFLAVLCSEMKASMQPQSIQGLTDAEKISCQPPATLYGSRFCIGKEILQEYTQTLLGGHTLVSLAQERNRKQNENIR